VTKLGAISRSERLGGEEGGRRGGIIFRVEVTGHG